MHGVAMAHSRRKVAPAQRDLAWIAELKLREKSERLRGSPWRESGHQVSGCWVWGRPVGRGCSVDLRTFQSSVWPWRKINVKQAQLQKPFFKICYFFSRLLRKSRPQFVSSPQLYSSSLQSVQEKLTPHFLSCDIEGSLINARKMEQWTKKERWIDRMKASALTEQSSRGNM